MQRELDEFGNVIVNKLLDKGIAIGEERGLEQGFERGMQQTVHRMNKLGLGIDLITQVTGLTYSDARKILKQSVIVN